MPSITTDDGLRLDFDDRGAPDGRPVLLLAGFTAARSSWLYQVPELERAGYRVIAADLRGHGTSDRPAVDASSMARRAADVDAILTALDLADVAVVAQSMGGNTLWAYLRDFGADRLAGAVVVDQTPRMLNDADWPFGFYGYDESNRDTHFAAGVPPTGHGTPLWRRGIRLVRLLKALRGERGSERQLGPAELAVLGDHARADWRPVIARTRLPLLFIAGADSEFWPSGHAAASAALTPTAESAVIPHDGHAANVEQPARFNRLMLEFLDRLPGGARA